MEITTDILKLHLFTHLYPAPIVQHLRAGIKILHIICLQIII